MAEAKKGDTVQVHYEGSLDDGTSFDTSRERDPLEFTIGSGQVIPGFDAAVVGMEPGDTRTVKVPAVDAYGPRREDLLAAVDRARFPDEIEVEVGRRVEVRQPDGTKQVLTIAEVGDEQVTLDANHPLAGKDLTFAIELVAIV